MTIVDALDIAPLTLTEIAEATSLPRATAHRLAVALEAHRLVRRDAAGRYHLGPRFGRPTLTEIAEPVLRRLRDRTGESVQLFVRRGSGRVCVLSLESPHSLRTIVPVGAHLPLDRGSAGRVLRGDAATAASVEEREKGVASVSAAIRDGDGRVVAAVSVSGPVERTTRSPAKRYGRVVAAAARDVVRALS